MVGGLAILQVVLGACLEGVKKVNLRMVRQLKANGPATKERKQRTESATSSIALVSLKISEMRQLMASTLKLSN